MKFIMDQMKNSAMIFRTLLFIKVTRYTKIIAITHIKFFDWNDYISKILIAWFFICISANGDNLYSLTSDFYPILYIWLNFNKS